MFLLVTTILSNPDEDAWPQQTDWITNISLAQEIQQLIGRYAKTGQPDTRQWNDLISLLVVIATLVYLLESGQCHLATAAARGGEALAIVVILFIGLVQVSVVACRGSSH